MTAKQKAALTAVLAILVGIGIYETLKNSRLREQLQVVQQQQMTMAEKLAQAKSEAERVSNQLQTSRSPAMNTERLRELLRLRGEVAVLRRRERELERVLASGQARASDQAAPSGVAEQGSSGAPFQVRLVSDNPAENT